MGCGASSEKAEEKPALAAAPAKDVNLNTDKAATSTAGDVTDDGDKKVDSEKDDKEKKKSKRKSEKGKPKEKKAAAEEIVIDDEDKEEMDKAASKIQNVYRRRKTLKERKKEVERKRKAKQAKEEEVKEQDEAARKIQKAFRKKKKGSRSKTSTIDDKRSSRSSRSKSRSSRSNTELGTISGDKKGSLLDRSGSLSTPRKKGSLPPLKVGRSSTRKTRKSIEARGKITRTSTIAQSNTSDLRNMSRSDVSELWYEVDINRDGSLDRKEMKELSMLLNDKILMTFKDEIKAGNPTWDEAKIEKTVAKERFYLLPGKNAKDNTPAMVKMMMKKLDVNNDGSVTRTEFLAQWGQFSAEIFKDHNDEEEQKDLECSIM